MAGNWMSISSPSGRAIASLGNRLLFSGHRGASLCTRRRGLVHSAYEKNVEAADHHHHEDQVIFRQPQSQVKSAKDDNNKFYYWEPHPQTGVFGPAAASGGATASSGRASTIDQQQEEDNAWFRPTSLEDLEKPHLP